MTYLVRVNIQITYNLIYFFNCLKELKMLRRAQNIIYLIFINVRFKI